MIYEPYSYCFLRYHHAPESGEFVNVGVLLWAPESRYLGFRSCSRFRRLSQFFVGFDAEGYRQMIARIDSRFELKAAKWANSESEFPIFVDRPPSAREIAFQVVPHDDAALQWSLSSGGETSDPKADLEQIFDQYIDTHNPGSERGRRDEAFVYREVFRQAFAKPKIAEFIKEHEVVAPLDQHVFQNAWKNGQWNVYETLAFDLADPDRIRGKALKWDSRAKHLSDSEERPKLHYMLGKPDGGRHAKAYGQAKDILVSSGRVTLIEEDESNDFAAELERAILDTAGRLDAG